MTNNIRGNADGSPVICCQDIDADIADIAEFRLQLYR